MKMNKNNVVGFVAVLLTMACGAASAELPAAVTTMFTDLAADAALIFTAAVAVWVAIRSSGAIMRLGNKFIGKAGA